MGQKIEYYDIRQAKKFGGYNSIFMIDYLCSQELIFPIAENGRGRGRKRLFTFRDLLILRIYKKLFDEGVSVKKLKTALKDSKEFNKLRITRDSRRCGRQQANLLVANSKDIFIRSDHNSFIRAGTNGQLVFSFMVNLREMHKELADDTKNARIYLRRENGQGFRRKQLSG